MTKNSASKADPVERIRRIYWYEGVRQATGLTSAYALERLFVTDGFGRNKDGILFNRSTWVTYKKGDHTPKPALVARVDLLVPGSSWEIHHIWWEVLRPSSQRSINSIKWLRQLEPELQILVFDGRDKIRNHDWPQVLEKIEHRASIDVLACLTILVFLSLENGHFEQASEFARSTLRVLLMLGHHFECRRIGSDLFKLYVEEVFNKVQWNEQRFYLDDYAFSQWASVLHLVAQDTTEAETHLMPSAEEIRVMCGVLRGTRGLDIAIAIDPLIGPDLDIGPPRKKVIDAFERALCIHRQSVSSMLPGE
ncbi:hypothetical protein [Herbaspirillum aquaticum]|uniref:hypothetical protein n=1 Tax=Herbaspirillum aquaticum TaxID=568783 RepID=UPI001131FA30|nr:hypothetical protein [Herbaspirillum aquaticum]